MTQTIKQWVHPIQFQALATPYDEVSSNDDEPGETHEGWEGKGGKGPTNNDYEQFAINSADSQHEGHSEGDFEPHDQGDDSEGSVTADSEWNIDIKVAKERA